jgi:ferritin-like metal-binding protein YciE
MANTTVSKTRRSRSNSDVTLQNGNGSAQKQLGKTGLKDVFLTELKDIYNAEKQLLDALPVMAEAAFTEELADAIYNHLEETERHVMRLEKIFRWSGKDAEQEEEPCKAMQGLIEEGNKIIEEFEEGMIRDTLLIIGSQKIEHYEIAVYGSLRDIAEVMGMEQIADILDRTLEEEELTDLLLTDIAMYVNEAADRESMSPSMN